MMAFSEVYQALQTGVVDGTENPISNFYTQKMHEVRRNTSPSPTMATWAMRSSSTRKFWEGLPEDIRTNLEKAMTATEYANTIAKEMNEKDLAQKASAKPRSLHSRPRSVPPSRLPCCPFMTRWPNASARRPSTPSTRPSISRNNPAVRVR